MQRFAHDGLARMAPYVLCIGFFVTFATAI